MTRRVFQPIGAETRRVQRAFHRRQLKRAGTWWSWTIWGSVATNENVLWRHDFAIEMKGETASTKGFQNLFERLFGHVACSL